MSSLPRVFGTGAILELKKGKARRFAGDYLNYTGETKDGVPDGEGTMTFSYGSEFGEFQNGVFVRGVEDYYVNFAGEVQHRIDEGDFDKNGLIAGRREIWYGTENFKVEEGTFEKACW